MENDNISFNYTIYDNRRTDKKLFNASINDRECAKSYDYSKACGIPLIIKHMAIIERNEKQINAFHKAFEFLEDYKESQEHENKVQQMLEDVKQEDKNNYNDNDNINNNKKELKLNLDVSEASSYDSEETQDINLIKNQEKKSNKGRSKKQISFNEWLKKKNEQKQKNKKRQKTLQKQFNKYLNWLRIGNTGRKTALQVESPYI